MDGANIVEVASQLGGFGVMVLFVWRIISHTLPKMAKTFEEGISSSRHDFGKMLQQQREDFKDGLHEHRAFCQKDIDRLIVAINDSKGEK